VGLEGKKEEKWLPGERSFFERPQKEGNVDVFFITEEEEKKKEGKLPERDRKKKKKATLVFFPRRKRGMRLPRIPNHSAARK